MSSASNPDKLLTNKTVYQEIWTADVQQGNGVPAILPSDTTTPRDKGYVIVNESTNFNKDTRLFQEVFIPEDKKSTYESCERLFRYYEVDSTKSEFLTRNQNENVDRFVNSIKDTAPMKVARQYLDPNMSDDVWASSIKSKWFTIFGNNGRSGFEHVLIGEWSGKKINGKLVKNVGGYHFWYKYYLDDGEGKVDGKDTIDYAGPNYGSTALNAEGRKVPDIATIRFKWDAFETENNTTDDLEKFRGGFWVGLSPEGLMALGMARFKEATEGKTRAVINGAEYTITLYTEIDRRIESNKGRVDDKYISTFWPKLERIVSTGGDTGGDNGDDNGGDTGGDGGSVRIIAALVNPGPVDVDKGNETVTLMNTSGNIVNCAGWRIVDKNNNGFTLPANIKLNGGESRTIPLSGDQGTAQLGNGGGEIILEDDDGKFIDEVSYTKRQARRQGVTIVF